MNELFNDNDVFERAKSKNDFPLFLKFGVQIKKMNLLESTCL